LAGFATQYVRTGDRRWWSLMDDLAAHVVDVDLYHTDGDRPAYNHGYFWHTNHYVDAGIATHRAYSRESGLPGGGPSAEHNYTTGLMMHHFLTGSAASRDAVIELGDWVLAMDDGARTPFRWLDAGPTGLASATYSRDFHGPGRGAGNSLKALVEATRLTHDMKYIRKAAVFEYAAGHASDPMTRATFLERAAFFFDYSVMTLAAKPTHTLTRPIVLLLAYAFQRPTLDLSLVAGMSVDSRVPAGFVAYKRRVIRNMAAVGGLAAVLSLVSALAFLHPW